MFCFVAPTVNYLTGPQGFVDTTSPLNGYFIQRELIYIIIAGSQYTDTNVLIRSLETFSRPPDCMSNYLEFFNGDAVNPAYSLGRICGQQSLVNAHFQTGVLTVQFNVAKYESSLTQQAIFSYTAYIGMFQLVLLPKFFHSQLLLLMLSDITVP